MSFKFELDTSDNNTYGTVELGRNNGSRDSYRIAIKHPTSLTEIRGGVVRFQIEKYQAFIKGHWSKKKYLSKPYLLDKDFIILLTNENPAFRGMDPAFEWIMFKFNHKEEGLYLTVKARLAKESIKDSDVVIINEGYILNKFQTIVLKILVKKNKKKRNEKGNI